MPSNINAFFKSRANSIKTTLNPKNVIKTVTPPQITNIIKQGPKNIIDNVLGDITGIKLSNLAGSIKAQIKGTISGMLANLQAEIIGCIKHMIRDFLNKNPLIEKILFFDQFINRKLLELRNKLDSKIDLELRKLLFQKIKIQQIALFKQKMRSAIDNICPDAAPASPTEVKKFKEGVRNIFKKNEKEGVETQNEGDEVLPESEIPESVDEVDTKTKEKRVSNKNIVAAKKGGPRLKELVNKSTNDVQKKLEEEAEKQVAENKKPSTWSKLKAKINRGFKNIGEGIEDTVEGVQGAVQEVGEGIQGAVQGVGEGIQGAVEGVSEGVQEASSEVRSIFVRDDS